MSALKLVLSQKRILRSLILLLFFSLILINFWIWDLHRSRDTVLTVQINWSRWQSWAWNESDRQVYHPERVPKHSLYLWNTDLHSGPLGCQLPLLKDLDVTVHGEIHYPHCGQYPDLCRTARFTGIGDPMGHYGIDQCPDMARIAIFERMKSLPEIQRIDVIQCSHPIANCEIWLPFNKSMILYATTRLEFGRLDRYIPWRREYMAGVDPDPLHPSRGIAPGTEPRALQRWRQWIKTIQRLAKVPGNVIAANSRYDAEYIHYFTGVQAEFIPSWCGDEATGFAQYTGTREDYLTMPARDNVDGGWNHPILKDLTDALLTEDPLEGQCSAVSSKPILNELGEPVKATLTTPRQQIVRMGQVWTQGYSWSDLASHRAIIILPHQISFMTFYELYRMAIPLFVPSQRLLTEWIVKYNLVWERVYGDPPRPGEDPILDAKYGLDALPPSTFPDPNQPQNATVLASWLPLADFYLMPHLLYFDSWPHLLRLMKCVDYNVISQAMQKENATQRKRQLATWKRIFDKIRKLVPPGQRVVPQDMDQGMKIIGMEPVRPDKIGTAGGQCS